MLSYGIERLKDDETQIQVSYVSCNLDKLVPVMGRWDFNFFVVVVVVVVVRALTLEFQRWHCRQKKAIRKEEEKELRKREEENADGQWADNPRSVEDFERLLLTQGDTSIVWIRC